MKTRIKILLVTVILIHCLSSVSCSTKSSLNGKWLVVEHNTNSLDFALSVFLDFLPSSLSSKVYWTQNGTVYHVYKDCGHINHEVELFEGDCNEAIEHGKTRLCSTCLKRAESGTNSLNNTHSMPDDTTYSIELQFDKSHKGCISITVIANNETIEKSVDFVWTLEDEKLSIISSENGEAILNCIDKPISIKGDKLTINYEDGSLIILSRRR